MAFKNLNFWKGALRVGLSLLAFICLIAVVLPIFDNGKRNAPRSTCQSNLKQIALGHLQYVQDYDGKFPLAFSGEGWADSLQPYLKSSAIFQCPSEASQPPQPADAKLTGYTDYYYNTQLQGRLEKKIGNLQHLVLMGDGNDGEENTNARYAKSTLPSSWWDHVKSPARRHLDGANYAFADGHVKWLLALKMKWQSEGVTFNPTK